MKEKGKKIYRASLLAPFRIVMFALAFFFYRDFYLSTFQEEKFLAGGKLGFWDVLNYHYRYPTELAILSLLMLTPIIYYGFIRGARFYEKGYVFNQGLPFFNIWVPYNEIQQYKLLLPKSILAIFTKAGDIHVVSDGHIERIIGVLDQHNVPGDLAQDAYVRLIQNVRKFFMVVLAFTVALYAVNKLGWLRIIS